MAPGPNLCRFERTSAERQTWRVGTRSPGHHPGLSCFSDAGVGTAAGAVAAAALEAAEEDRVVEVDVTERAPQQLEGVAAERVCILGVDAELLGDARVTLA